MTDASVDRRIVQIKFFLKNNNEISMYEISSVTKNKNDTDLKFMNNK